MSRCKTKAECESPISCEQYGRCWRDTEGKPHLFYRSCWRDAHSVEAAQHCKKTGNCSDWRLIPKGALRGCLHQRHGKAVLLVRKDHVLEFHVAIRVRI